MIAVENVLIHEGVKMPVKPAVMILDLCGYGELSNPERITSALTLVDNFMSADNCRSSEALKLNEVAERGYVIFKWGHPLR